MKKLLILTLLLSLTSFGQDKLDPIDKILVLNIK